MKTLGQKQKQQSLQMLKRQAMFVLLLFIIIFAFFGFYASIATIVGGSISLFANLLCIMRMFRSQGMQVKRALGQFYSAELLKLASTAILLALCFNYFNFNSQFLLLGYVSAQLGFWLMPLILKRTYMNEVTTDAEQLS